MDYITKTGDKAEVAITGAKRDSQEGKWRFDLIDLWFLKRLADLLARGAAHYGERNWEAGQPLSRTYASLLRHAFAVPEDETEDHLAAVGFNAMSMVHTIMEVRAGRLPLELLDLGIYKPAPVQEPEASHPGYCPTCAVRTDECLCDVEPEVLPDYDPPCSTCGGVDVCICFPCDKCYTTVNESMTNCPKCGQTI